MPAPMGHPPYNTKGEGGRPPIYTNEVIEKIAEEFEEWLKKPDSLFIKDFCLERFVNPDIMTYWAARNERFMSAYKLSKHIQENRLKKGAIYKELDVSFTKFLLVNNHGAESFSDKTESKVTSIDETSDGFVMNRIKSTKDLVDGNTKDN